MAKDNKDKVDGVDGVDKKTGDGAGPTPPESPTAPENQNPQDNPTPPASSTEDGLNEHGHPKQRPEAEPQKQTPVDYAVTLVVDVALGNGTRKRGCVVGHLRGCVEKPGAGGLESVKGFTWAEGVLNDREKAAVMENQHLVGYVEVKK